MRTTILLDDRLAERLRKAARDRGLSLSAFLAEAGRAALKAPPASDQEPFELIIDGDGGVLSGVNLDKPSAMIAAEDEEHYHR